jgi:hypothetical protein
MTEELEKKLNELLGLKKQFEEITAEKQKATTSLVIEQYKKMGRRARVRSLIGSVMALVFMEFGVLGLCSTQVIIMGHDITGTPAQYIFGAIAFLFGVLCINLMVITLRIALGKYAILQEIRQFELRITEMLKKQ